MNDAIKQLDSSLHLLSQRAYAPCLDKSFINFYFERLKGKISYSQFAEIVENCSKPSIDSFQKGYLKNVILLSDEQLDLIQEKNRQNYNPIYYYTISVPVFDKKKNFAVVNFAKGFGTRAMDGYYCLFKRINGQWKLIARFNSWAS